MEYNKEVGFNGHDVHYNGKVESNGNGSSSSSTGKMASKTAHQRATPSSTPPTGKKGSLIGNYMSLRRMSKRPLPKDMGDGRYRQLQVRPGLRQDLRTIGWGGKRTYQKDNLKCELWLLTFA
jgi:hypothetical protein